MITCIPKRFHKALVRAVSAEFLLGNKYILPLMIACKFQESCGVCLFSVERIFAVLNIFANITVANWQQMNI